MADTTWATGDAATRKVWAKRWWIAAQEESYFYSHGYVGPENENRHIIVEKGDLEKSPGDRITMGQFSQLTGNGVTGDSQLEDNEEAMEDYTFTVTINQVRNGIRLLRMGSQRFAANKQLRTTAKTLLQTWMAEYIDENLFTALSDSPSKVVYAGDATSTATLEATDLFTLGLVSKACTLAEKAVPLIRGVPMAGERMYVCVMANDQSYDLTENEARWEQANRDAGPRTSKNRLWTGALGEWKNTIMHRHTNVPIST